MPHSINKKHFEKLKSSSSDTYAWPEGAPRLWYEWVKTKSGIDVHPAHLPENASKNTLKEMVNNCQTDTASCCFSILAWGGMNRKHGAMLNSCGSNWLTHSENIRMGKLDRVQAYAGFSELRSKGELKGMAPAYFTKLIFFLMAKKRPRGYIMDQWTSASVNLLSGNPIVEMQRSFFQLKTSKRIFETVSDRNTPSNYDEYCNFVEMLSTEKWLDVDPERVEEMLFSKGRGQGSWRNYLVSMR